MTLLEMIKKWEKMKAKIVAESGSRPTGDIVIVDAVLEDLHSVEAHPSVTNICDKLLKKIDRALEGGDFTDAHTLAQILGMLPE